MDDGQMEADGRDRLCGWIGCMNVIFRLVRQAECRDLQNHVLSRIAILNGQYFMVMHS